MRTVRLILALHSHQPVGNFEEVFRKGVRLAYRPMLDVINEFPDIRWAMHYSGPLWEWLEENEHGLTGEIIANVRAGRFELMGGGYGEPILTMLPDGDAVGQVRTFTQHLRRRYGVAVRGAWLTERIWEAHLASVLADAGIEYTVVDDFHFLVSGLRSPQLTGSFLTEDKGRKLRLFAGSEFLRYSIPFRDPEDTIEHLRGLATEDGENVIVYADDGEKFGLWPETYKHVYEKGWLRRFLELLDRNKDWIRFTTFSETIDELPPVGKVYLADASYREMTEWALPVPAQIEMAAVMKDLQESHLAERARPFIRGGSWRSFKTKYVEAAQMYARMMEVSALVADRAAAKNAEEARLALYRAQCNCAYWHGVFGGLYMPFLRVAVYRELLRAENLLAGYRDRPGHAVHDFDLDGRDEIKLHTGSLNAYLKPDRGGVLYELDDRSGEMNLTAVMTRRPEFYHNRLLDAAQKGCLGIVGPDGVVSAASAGNGAVSIHDLIRAKEPGLERILFHDPCVRDSLIDHFHPAGTTPDDLRRAIAPELGDFVSARYEAAPQRSKAATVVLTRSGVIRTAAHTTPVSISKRIVLDGNTLEARYALSFPEGAPEGVVFAPELNLGLMAGASFDRNYFTPERENLGNLSTLLDRPAAGGLGLVDDFLKLEIWCRVSPDAHFWAYPVETVNDSEGGFERVYQCSAVLPYWPLAAQPGEEVVVTLTLEVRHR